MKNRKILLYILCFTFVFLITSCNFAVDNVDVADAKVLEYSFDETVGSLTKETVF